MFCKYFLICSQKCIWHVWFLQWLLNKKEIRLCEEVTSAINIRVVRLFNVIKKRKRYVITVEADGPGGQLRYLVVFQGFPVYILSLRMLSRAFYLLLAHLKYKCFLHHWSNKIAWLHHINPDPHSPFSSFIFDRFPRKLTLELIMTVDNFKPWKSIAENVLCSQNSVIS